MELTILALCVIVLAIIYVLLFPNRYTNNGCTILRASRKENYGYGLDDGPHTWNGKYRLAELRHQSPVNIESTLVRLIQQQRSMLSFAHFEEIPLAMHLKITEHSIELWPSFPCCPPLVQWRSAANTVSVFRMEHIAFRWCSEHTIDHQQFPLEIQSYFRRCKDPASTQTHSDDVLAISNLFTETVNKNFYLDPICIHLKNHNINTSWLSSANHIQSIYPPFPIVWLCPDFKQGFYQYPGSLTVPPCSETVTWLVNTELFSISSSQLNSFKCMQNSCGSQILTNRRPVQPLNDRVVLLNQFVD